VRLREAHRENERHRHIAEQAEKAAEDAGQRLHASQQECDRYRTERDALLALVSQLHLSGHSSAPAPQLPTPVPHRPSLPVAKDARQGVGSVDQLHPGLSLHQDWAAAGHTSHKEEFQGHGAARPQHAHANDRGTVAPASAAQSHAIEKHSLATPSSAPAPSMTAQSPHVAFQETAASTQARTIHPNMHTASASHDSADHSVFLKRHYPTPSPSHDPYDQHREAGVPLSRSADSGQRRAGSVDFDDSASSYSESTYSSTNESGSEPNSEEDSELKDSGVQTDEHPSSAGVTSNVLDVSDSDPRYPLSAALPQQHVAALAGALSVPRPSEHKAGKKGPRKSALADSGKKSLRSSSGSSQKKKPTPIKGTPQGLKSAASPEAAAAGAAGKSMVIRKPPTYTGAPNELVRGKGLAGSSANKEEAPKVKPATSGTSKKVSAKAEAKRVLQNRLKDSGATPATTGVKINYVAEEAPVSFVPRWHAHYALTLLFVIQAGSAGNNGLDAAGLTISHTGYIQEAVRAVGQEDKRADYSAGSGAGERSGLLEPAVEVPLPPPPTPTPAASVPPSNNPATHNPQATTSDATKEDPDEKDDDILGHTLEIARLPGPQPAFVFQDMSHPTDTSVQSARSARSARSGSSKDNSLSKKKPRPHMGITNIKIQRKGQSTRALQGEGFEAPPPVAAQQPVRAVSTPCIALDSKKASATKPQRARTPSPMLRSHAPNGVTSRGTVTGGQYYTPVSYSRTSGAPAAAVIVTPASALRGSGGSSKKIVNSSAPTGSGRAAGGDRRKASLLF
jgi:hypothetical protein